MEYIWFYSLAFIAEIIGTISGFGSSVFFVPLASLFFDFKTVLAITAVLHVFSNISKLILFLKKINLKTLMLLGVPGIIFVAFGAILTNTFKSEILEFSLAIFLVLFSILFLVKPKLQLPSNPTTLIGSGSLAGFLAGLVGTGGTFRGMALAALNLPKSSFIVTSAAIDMGVDVTRAVIYLTEGYLLKSNYFLIIPLILIAWIGSYTGKKILSFINEERFRKIVLVCILVIGIFTMWNLRNLVL